MLGTFISDSLTWAERVFGGSTLCDERLTDRLVQYAAAQALDPEGSTSRVTGGSKAAREGAYRFLENPRVLPADIDEGPFEHTASLCKGRSRILAVQDTTSVAVASNELREALVSSGSPTGFIVHNTLMVDGESGEVLGLIDQQRWTRETSLSKGGYGPKESAKWGIADLAMASRLGNVSNVITVSDRESDIFELLAYYQETDRRFVVRALHNRQLSGEIGQVFEQVRASEVLGHREIHVEQRGAVPKKVPNPGRRSRPRRKVLTSVQAVRATIAPPGGEGGVGFSPLTLNVVRVSEAKPPDDTSEALEWILLTTEPIATLQDVLRVVQAYEGRWVIEEFHKCWKTGCRLESRPLGSLDAVERMMAITAPIAIRILQLHTAARSEQVDRDVETTLTSEEWQCLWASTEAAPLPKERPSAKWALLAVARLGSWHDTKKTGRIGWSTLWHGWSKLQERLVGWRAARGAVGGA
jgi:hypothetical protein